MIIQSKKVWIADQFTPAQLELEDGIIKEIYPYNEKRSYERLWRFKNSSWLY